MQWQNLMLFTLLLSATPLCTDGAGTRFYVIGGYSHAYAKCMEDGWVLQGKGGASQLTAGTPSWSQLPRKSSGTFGEGGCCLAIVYIP
jgi:hypothetical protein